MLNAIKNALSQPNKISKAELVASIKRQLLTDIEIDLPINQDTYPQTRQYIVEARSIYDVFAVMRFMFDVDEEVMTYIAALIAHAFGDEE